MRLMLLTVLLAGVMTSAIADSTSAPAFKIRDTLGHEIDFPRQQSGVDIYFFWASWCPYCKALMPHLQSIVEEYGDSVRVYAFNIRDDVDPRELMEKAAYDFIVIPQADSLMELYGVKGTPGLFLVDEKGEIQLNLYRLVHQDELNFDELRNSQKAARLAPWWASEIRKKLDTMLEHN
jgi:thiol-disulfide isomerase/thioredoxin